MEKTYSIAGTLTAVSQAVTLDTREMNTVLVTLNGTYTLTVTFEGTDDGTTWYPVQAAQVNANTIATTHSTANATQAYEFSCHAFQYVRVRCSAYTSGTANVRITGTQRAVEPAPASQVTATQPVSAVGTTSPGTTTTAVNSAATTNAANVKTTAATLYVACINNASAATKYVRFYNKASAPVPGTDTPIVVIAVPATSSVVYEFGQVGMRFATGLGHAITNGAAVLDATVVAAGDVQLAYNWI